MTVKIQQTYLTTWQQWCPLNFRTAVIGNMMLVQMLVVYTHHVTSNNVIWQLTHSCSFSTILTMNWDTMVLLLAI